MGTMVEHSWIVETALRAQSGDEAAFERLATHFRAAVTAVTFTRVRGREDAEDLTQEVLVMAREKLGDLRDPEAFPGWLRTIALNVCRTWNRRPRIWPDSLDAEEWSLSLRDPSPGPLEALLARERQRDWRRALRMLPETNRIALLMHVWGGYPYEEIAAFAGVSVGTVAGRIHRAKSQLRRVLRSGAGELLGEPRRRWREEDK